MIKVAPAPARPGRSATPARRGRSACSSVAASSPDRSIAGDTVPDSQCNDDPEEIEARHEARSVPLVTGDGVPRSRGESSDHNREHWVGNMGIFYGNWGERGTLAGDAKKRAQKMTSQKQVMKSPAQIIILCEATQEVEDDLRLPNGGASSNPQSRLDQRHTFEHWVVRGNEPKNAILIAARKDTCAGMQMLGNYEVFKDHEYQEKGKLNHARSRIMVCAVQFKQNIGHLGKEIVFLGTHGNFRTMKFMWKEPHVAYFDRLAAKIKQFGAKFLAGDWNMSLTEVTKQLRSRGLFVDCVAWYPWIHASEKTNEQRLGLDSCGIFYVGGCIEIVMRWGLNDIDLLTAVAGTAEEEELQTLLDEYDGHNTPGQPWSCYRSKNLKENPRDKNLGDRLRDLLGRSTEPKDLPKRTGTFCPYLRLKQKVLDKKEWMVKHTDGNGVAHVGMHNGAHFPLCVFTNNERARSRQKQYERSQKKRRSQPVDVSAVADDTELLTHGGGVQAWETVWPADDTYESCIEDSSSHDWWGDWTGTAVADRGRSASSSSATYNGYTGGGARQEWYDRGWRD